MKFDKPEELRLETITSKEKISIASLLSGFTEIEQDILYFFYDFNRAVSVKEMFDKFKETIPGARKLYPHIVYINILSNRRLISYQTAPSFRRINQTIGNLVKLNIIFKRSPETLTDKKVTGLYYLNPIVRDKINEYVSSQEKNDIKSKN